MIERVVPQSGQESVWDYPRPPRLEACTKRIRIVFNGVKIADSTQTLRLLETSHPPSYYLPPSDLLMEHFTATPRHTFCEFKGQAHYWTLQVGDQRAENAAWSYPKPNAAYSLLKDHLAFYPGRMQACYVDDELVTPQEGDFYGGWITSQIVGPFKGGAGTWGW
jgi:uncharacterized protein (DUF427 family)